jgi:hypothetical protein
VLGVDETERLEASANRVYRTRGGRPAPKQAWVGAICRTDWGKRLCEVNNETGVPAELADSSVARKANPAELPERTLRGRREAAARRTGKALRSLALRFARCWSSLNAVPRHPQAPLPGRDEVAGVMAKGNASCRSRGEATKDCDEPVSFSRDAGIVLATRWDFGSDDFGSDDFATDKGIGVLAVVSGGESGSKSGQCSANQRPSGMSRRRQSRIQRANLASTSASAHLSMISCASFRSIARRFKCESSKDSNAGFDAVRRNSSCGWTGAMRIPPYFRPPTRRRDCVTL